MQNINWPAVLTVTFIVIEFVVFVIVMVIYYRKHKSIWGWPW
jgi:multisubunit Na+/H+ antiporter MnhC subunit